MWKCKYWLICMILIQSIDNPAESFLFVPLAALTAGTTTTTIAVAQGLALIGAAGLAGAAGIGLLTAGIVLAAKKKRYFEPDSDDDYATNYQVPLPVYTTTAKPVYKKSSYSTPIYKTSYANSLYKGNHFGGFNSIQNHYNPVNYANSNYNKPSYTTHNGYYPSSSNTNTGYQPLSYGASSYNSFNTPFIPSPRDYSRSDYHGFQPVNKNYYREFDYNPRYYHGFHKRHGHSLHKRAISESNRHPIAWSQIKELDLIKRTPVDEIPLTVEAVKLMKPIIDDAAVKDNFGCAGRLLCEMHQKPKHQLLPEEKVLVNYFAASARIKPTEKEISNPQGKFHYAVYLGTIMPNEATLCGKAFPRCPVNSTLLHQVFHNVTYSI